LGVLGLELSQVCSWHAQLQSGVVDQVGVVHLIVVEGRLQLVGLVVYAGVPDDSLDPGEQHPDFDYAHGQLQQSEAGPPDRPDAHSILDQQVE